EAAPGAEIARSRVICDASINLTLVQLEQCLPAGSPPLCNGCEGLLYRLSRDRLENIDPRGLLAEAAGHGVDKFLVVTRLLPKCELGKGGYTACERVVHLLREHALVVAKSLGVAPATSQAIPWHASVVNDTRSVLRRLHRRIVDCRTLYYLVLGYGGPAQPTSLGALGVGEEGEERARLLTCSGLWVNMAVVELLAARLVADCQSVDSSAVESALAWLECGLAHHVTELGARVQMWTALLQITMVGRPLVVKDFVRVHGDLGYGAEGDALHLAAVDFAPINSVLVPVLRAASSATLEALAAYLTHVGYANTELAF
ncbi:hypothetical protein H4S07_005946, partial [Coemansia furcata]